MTLAPCCTAYAVHGLDDARGRCTLGVAYDLQDQKRSPRGNAYHLDPATAFGERRRKLGVHVLGEVVRLVALSDDRARAPEELPLHPVFDAVPSPESRGNG